MRLGFQVFRIIPYLCFQPGQTFSINIASEFGANAAEFWRKFFNERQAFSFYHKKSISHAQVTTINRDCFPGKCQRIIWKQNHRCSGHVATQSVCRHIKLTVGGKLIWG
ncbi:MAG: hypothetical protein ABT10_23125 [Novosphingobium sp. SCN 63-17]|nr:MAG: hypothetical protein ABT10_23125 [Novosphingobium sp. SCN 63-17]OJX88637.1 MAG: hypothetical protein BGP00_00945 [Novosphingobium sp. 63-713]